VKGAEEAPRPLRETLLAGTFFLAYTILATWPQAIHLSDGLVDLLDAKLSAWIFHWDWVQTLRDPANLFQAPILHPAKYVLAFSENLYGAAAFGFPLLAAGASAVTNYNVLLLAGMFLSALSAWALARYVTGDALASLAAGVVYGFLPYKLAQLPHVHMEWGPFLCLVFLFLLRYLDLGRRRDAVLLAVAFAWNAIACIQYAFFTGFLVVIVLALELVQGGPQRGRRVVGAVLAMGIGTLAFVPFAIPYQKASDLYGMRRTVGEMTFFSAKPGYFLSAGERNRLWGALTERFRGPEGDFFPGVLALGFAVVAVVRGRRREPPADRPEGAVSTARLRAARGVDGVILLLVAVWFAVRSVPHLRIGPLSLGDAGRVQVFLTLAVVLRLALAFPKRSRYASLADFLRRQRLDRRVLLLLAIAIAGVLVALGGNTPYYRFLFLTFGALFRAIRVAARGVVLFQAAFAVLAAWGLSRLTRRRSPGGRASGVAFALVLLTLEYRAFPITIYPYDSRPVPVYEWLRSSNLTGGLVEMPLGFPHDCEYTLRQAEHGKPLVNGHSSFAPKPYEELYPLVQQRPIPDTLWDRLDALDARLIVLHADARGGNGLELLQYVRLVRRGIEEGRVEAIGSFPHGRDTDIVLRPADAAPVLPIPPRSAQQALDALRVADARIAPPFGEISFPEPVWPGQWHGAWALDDSGIAEVRIASERGYEGSALLHMKWPGISQHLPDYPEAKDDRGGFGFGIPDLSPGTHVLTFTLIANDGGRTILKRTVEIRPVPTRPPARAPARTRGR
jgi:hypothetical protein